MTAFTRLCCLLSISALNLALGTLESWWKLLQPILRQCGDQLFSKLQQLPWPEDNWIPLHTSNSVRRISRKILHGLRHPPTLQDYLHSAIGLSRGKSSRDSPLHCFFKGRSVCAKAGVALQLCPMPAYNSRLKFFQAGSAVPDATDPGGKHRRREYPMNTLIIDLYKQLNLLQGLICTQ